MRSFMIPVVGFLALVMGGCAVSGSLSTATVTTDGRDISVQSSDWGGALACDSADVNLCSAAVHRSRVP